MGSIYPSIEGFLDYCPIMPKGHPNGRCDCPQARRQFGKSCHENGECKVITIIPGAREEAVQFEDQHAC